MKSFDQLTKKQRQDRMMKIAAKIDSMLGEQETFILIVEGKLAISNNTDWTRWPAMLRESADALEIQTIRNN